jgi:hypothetical protein
MTEVLVALAALAIFLGLYGVLHRRAGGSARPSWRWIAAIVLIVAVVVAAGQVL